MEIIMEHVRLCWAQRAHRGSQSGHPARLPAPTQMGGLLVELEVGAMTGLLSWDSFWMLLAHRESV